MAHRVLTNGEVVDAWQAVLALQASPTPASGKVKLRLARIAQELRAQVRMLESVASALRAEHFPADPTGRSYVAAEMELLTDTVELDLPSLDESDIEDLEVSGSIAGILPILTQAAS